MVKRTETKVAGKRREMTHGKSAAFKAAKTGKKGSSFTRSKASTNPNRPDPSGGKKGS